MAIAASKIRVLVVDDAVVIRKILTDALSTDPDVEVVGTAANGKIALSKLDQLKPDLVTLDVEMPEMDGLTTLRELRKTHARLPVIMFSTLTARGATSTLDALAAGASDYVTKPANVGSVTAAITRIREELIPKIKALCGRSNAPAVTALPKVFAKPLLAGPRPVVEAVVIGVSTGGPNALAEVIPALPGDLPVPVLIVQHMPPVFTKQLAERLAAKSKVPVREGTPGEVVRPGVVYVAPGDYHMTVVGLPGRRTLAMTQAPPENSCRPAVDVLFRSAAATYKGGTLAVVLTGMGQDGLAGCEAVRKAGGGVLVQDQASSVVWGMPGFVARAGLAEQQVPLKDVAVTIARRVGDGRRRLSA